MDVAGLLNELNLVKSKQNVIFFFSQLPPCTHSVDLRSSPLGEITSRSHSFPGHAQVIKSPLSYPNSKPSSSLKALCSPLHRPDLDSETGSRSGHVPDFFFLLCPLLWWLLLGWQGWGWEEWENFSSIGETSHCHLSFVVSGGWLPSIADLFSPWHLCGFFGGFHCWGSHLHSLLLTSPPAPHRPSVGTVRFHPTSSQIASAFNRVLLKSYAR